MNRLEIFEQVYGPTEWSQSALTSLMAVADLVYAKAKEELTQPLTDPENQPSQFGTVTLEMYEAKEGELEQLKSDLKALWNNRGDDINVTVAKLLVKHRLTG